MSEDEDKIEAASTPAGAAPEPEEAPEPNADTGEGLSDADVAQLNRTAQVINNFYGDVEAGSAQFGVTLGVSTRRATGPVDEAQVRRAHDHFVAPPRHDDASRVLRDEHLVVLAGPENSGRTTSAINLLCSALGDTRAPLTGLSPAMTLTKLSEYPHFKPGRGYLVRGWVDDAQPLSVQHFELSRLARRLRELGSFLVLVTDSAHVQHQELDTWVVRWEPPSPEALFDAYASPDSDPEARARASELGTPAEVVEFAKSASHGLEAALARLGGSAAAQVSDWFDAEPDRRATLEVAALAFAHGLPDRVFEAAFERLLAIAEPTAVDAPLDTALRQSRAQWQDHPLIRTTRDVQGLDGLTGDRRVVFRSVEHRRQVIAELVTRYGFELWDPVRAWLHELAAQRPPSELHFQVALGVSLLAKDSLREAELDFLDQWANGTVVARLTASHVLTWMCMDDALAPHALRIALSWSSNAGTRRAMTAATALGGEIGSRYPADALRVLWFLASRSEKIAEVARVSLGLLISSSVDGGGEVTHFLTLLQKLVRQDVARGTEYQRVQLSLTALLTVLSHDRADSDEPLAAHVLRSQPECVHTLAEIWRWVLWSGSHRGRAIRALRRTLDTLDEHSGTRPVVVELGRAIRSGLPAAQLELVRRDLQFALSDHASAAAFLSALAPQALTA